MKTRILTAIVMLSLFIPVLWFSELIVYPIAMALLVGIAGFELVRCLGLHRDLYLSVPAVMIPAGLTFLSYFSKSPTAHFGGVAIAFFLLAVYLLAVAVFRAGRTTYASVMGVMGGSFYITVAFSSMVLIRYMPNGAYLFLLPFIGAWVSDTFAYFTGRFLGRHKLAPIISPKKTVEGSIGGIVFAVGVFALYGLFLSSRGFTPNYLALCLAGLFVSVLSQIGDLALSLLKRECGIKDYGRLFPGHGGVLDRFDSVIATAPIILILSLLGDNLALFV